MENIQKKIFNVYRKKIFGNASDNCLRNIRGRFFPVVLMQLTGIDVQLSNNQFGKCQRLSAGFLCRGKSFLFISDRYSGESISFEWVSVIYTDLKNLYHLEVL